MGADLQIEDALCKSEGSSALNTSFIERLNLTVRQGSAYLHRRTACHVRRPEYLDDHLELLRCYYNFVRPHRGLKFGKGIRTPAMQAGLVKSRLSFREIFMTLPKLRLFVLIFIGLRHAISQKEGLREAA